MVPYHRGLLSDHIIRWNFKQGVWRFVSLDIRQPVRRFADLGIEASAQHERLEFVGVPRLGHNFQRALITGLASREQAGKADALSQETFDDLRTEGRTIMVIDHDPGFVAACCDRVACMNFGKVLVTGTPDEVLSSDEVRRSYLGDDLPA